MKFSRIVDMTRTRWLLARVGHRFRIDTAFKVPARRADRMTGRRRMVDMMFRGMPELFIGDA
jgi:hypothetical protein